MLQQAQVPLHNYSGKARRMGLQDLSFAEKDFYLDEFHDRTLLFALRASDLDTDESLEAATEVLGTLLLNETNVLLLIETSGRESELRRIKALNRQVARPLKIAVTPPTELSANMEDDELLAQIWTVLRASPLFIGLWPTNPDVSLMTCAQRAAVHLRVYKLILIDPAGSITTGGSRLSFMTGPVLRELLRPGESEWAGLGDRRPLLETIRATLEGGVPSVTLCPLSGLALELLTYEGCGTLFTLTDYCQVEKLGIDDFHEVETLLQRGEREGYLKTRTSQETTQLLLHGYGARLGPAPGQLAGFCALLPYPAENAAEIVGLSTITRYQGEGIGGRLIDHMFAEGERHDLAYVFACTTQEGARRLFERHGFLRVPAEEVPAAKWHGYDSERRQRVAVYRRNLPPTEQRLELR